MGSRVEDLNEWECERALEFKNQSGADGFRLNTRSDTYLNPDYTKKSVYTNIFVFYTEIKQYRKFPAIRFNSTGTELHDRHAPINSYIDVTFIDWKIQDLKGKNKSNQVKSLTTRSS
jgi:hypothetical protein